MFTLHYTFQGKHNCVDCHAQGRPVVYMKLRKRASVELIGIYGKKMIKGKME